MWRYDPPHRCRELQGHPLSGPQLRTLSVDDARPAPPDTRPPHRWLSSSVRPDGDRVEQQPEHLRRTAAARGRLAVVAASAGRATAWSSWTCPPASTGATCGSPAPVPTRWGRAHAGGPAGPRSAPPRRPRPLSGPRSASGPRCRSLSGLITEVTVWIWPP